MPELKAARRHRVCPRSARLSGLLTGVSVVALLSGAPERAAADPRGYWDPATAAAAAAAAVAAGAEQGAAAAAQAQQSITAASQAIRGMWTAQDAARAAATLGQSANIVNGLGRGTAGQLPGLVVDPRVPKDLAQPKPGENPNLWLNADLPRQTTSGSETLVTIRQTAPQAVMTWEYFNIGQDTTLVFDQQGHASWVALNRIDATGVPSQIEGRIKADGTVLVINPNGIVFGPKSQVNLGGLIASALDIDSSAAASAFNGELGDKSAYTRLTLPDGVSVAVPPNEDSANRAFVQNGLFSATDAAKTRGAVLFSLGDQSLESAGKGAVTLRRGASVTTSVTSSGDGGIVALLGTSVTNEGGISAPGGQVILAASNTVQLTYPASTTTGVARQFSVSPVADNSLAQVDPRNTTPPSLGGAGRVTNAANGILAARNGAVTLVGDHIEQHGGIAVTTSVTRPGSVTLDTSRASPEADGDIVFGPGSLLAILPDEESGTIPTATATADYFASTLQPRISVSARGNIDVEPDARIRAPSAQVTMNAGLGGTGTILLQSGSSIDLSGLAGVVLPVTINEVTFLLTAAEVANTPLAENLIGTTVTIDARVRGTRADGVEWVGSPLLEAGGYVGLVPKTIEELLTTGGRFTASSPQNFIQQPGSVIDVSGGFVSYEGGTIETTRLLGTNGRIYDIGSADPSITYTGVAGQFVELHPQWGVSEVYTNPLLAGGRVETDHIAGASAGGVTVHAIAPILDGTIEADIVTGPRQRALARGGGVTPQASLDQLPAGASLNIVFESGTDPFRVVLRPRTDAGSDPYGLGGFSLETASSWSPLRAGSEFPIFTDRLSASGFASISIKGAADVRNPLRMTADAALTVRPGGSVTLDSVTTIDGKIHAPSGSITLAGLDVQAPPITDLVIGRTAVLDVRGLWVNDSGAAGDAIRGAAFIDGGSVTITTPAASIITTTRIASGKLADGTDVAGQTLLGVEDVTQSIVLAAGSVIDVSSGGYVGVNGAVRIGPDGLPVGKGGNLTLQAYAPAAETERLSRFKFSGIVGPEDPVRLADGTILRPGTEIYHYRDSDQPFGDPNQPSFPAYIVPVDGHHRANVVLAGTIHAAGFDGGGTFALRAPAITITGESGPVTSYLSASSLAGIAAQTGQGTAAYTTPGTTNIGASAARVAVSADKSGEISLPASFFAGNAFGAYVLTSAVGDVTVAPGTRIVLRQNSLLPGGAPGTGLDTRQPSGAIPRDFAIFGEVADGLRKPVDLSLVDPNGIRGVLVDKGAAIVADRGASGPASISLVSANGPATVLGSIVAPSGDINIFNVDADVAPYAPPLMARDIWIGAGALLDVSSIFVPEPRVVTHATGRLRDAGTITLGGRTVVVEDGARLRLDGAAAMVQVQDLSATTDPGFVDVPVWSNGGSLRIAGDKLYFAGTVSARGGAPLAAGGSLTIGNVPVPDAVARYVVGASDATGNTLEGHLPGPSTIVVQPAGNIAASLEAARRTSGSDAIFPVTPEDLVALVPVEAGGHIGSDTLGRSGFDSVSIFAETIAFNGSAHVSVPGALTLVASSGSFVLLPASATLLPPGVTYTGNLWSVDPSAYTTPAGPNGVPGIGGAVVTLDAAYIRLVGGGGLDSDAGGTLVPPRVADGTLQVTAQWIDLQRTIGIDNVLDAHLTSTGSIRLLPDNFGYASATAADGLGRRHVFGGALAAPGNLTLTAAEIFPATETQFLLVSTGTLAGVNDTLTIRQNGIARAPFSAGGSIVLDAVNIVQAGTLWAPLGSITVGLSDPDLGQLPSGIKDVLLNAGAFFVATQDVHLEAGSLTSVSSAGLTLPYGYTIDGKSWSVGTLFSGNPTITPPTATVITAAPPKAINSFGVNITLDGGAVIDASGGGDIYATEFASGIGGTRNVLTTGAEGRTVYALVPRSVASLAAYDPTFAANYDSDGSAIAPGTAITITGGRGIPAGTYVLLPGMYATLPGAYRVVEVAGNVNPSGPGIVATEDGSVLVKGTVTNALTGVRSASTHLFELQADPVWRQYSKIDITSGTTYFSSLAVESDAVVPPLPIDGGLLALGATRSLRLDSTNRFGAGTSTLTPGLAGSGGEVSISAANILVLAADRQRPSQTQSETRPYLLLDADQVSHLGASRVVIGGTILLDKPGTIAPTATSVEIATNAAHPLSGPEIVLVTKGSADGNGITVDVGSVIRANGTAAAGTGRDIRIGSVADRTSGDGALLRVSSGSMIEVARANVTDAPTGRITIGTMPGTTNLEENREGAVVIEARALTLDSSGRTVLASDTELRAKDYDLAADVINIGGGSSGLVLAPGLIAGFADAQTVRLRSATVFNLFDAAGLVVGETAKPIGTLIFDGAGFYGEGGTSTVNTRNLVLTNSRATAQPSGGLDGSNGTLIINASGTLTQGSGSFALRGFGRVGLNAGESIGFSGTGALEAGAAHVALAAPTLIVNAGATQALRTSGQLDILSGAGPAPTNAAENIGGALALTGASIFDSGRIEALSGNVVLTATSGDITLAEGAQILAKGSEFGVLDQSVAAAGGSVKLAAANNVTIAAGALVDVSAAGNGYAGALALETGANGTATLHGALHGGAAHDDTGGRFALSAGTLAGALPLAGGFTSSFRVALEHGDILIGTDTTLTSGDVLLVADRGSVIVAGTIDAKGPSGGTIALYGADRVSVEAGARLIARYEPVGPDDPGYASGASRLTQTGGTIVLGTTGTRDGTFNAVHGYQNVTSSGTVTVASGAILDVSGGPGGTDIVNTGGEVLLRAPILADGRVNVGFHGTLVTNADAEGIASGKGLVLAAYAAWSTTDTTTGRLHFDGIIDPAGWYDANGQQIDGTRVQSIFTPTEPVNADHVGFYQKTLVGFVQSFAATADFSGASLRVGNGPEVALPESLRHARPEIELVNPSLSVNGGDITVASNWNLGAGVFDSHGNYVPHYRTLAGEPGILTLKAADNIDVEATISDGFYETRDAFGGSILVANFIANNPQASGAVQDFNTTSAASPMPVVQGINNGSFSYRFVAGAAFHADGRSSVDPEDVVAADGSERGRFAIDGHTTYINPYSLGNPYVTSPTRFINVPTLVRTGTGSITIKAAGNVAVLDKVAPGAIYTAGAAVATPSGFTAPAMSAIYAELPNGLVSTPTWAAGGGDVRIEAGQSIVGIAPSVTDPFTGRYSGQDWNAWYYRSGASNGSGAPFSGLAAGADAASCGPASFSCQTAAWVNYATFKGFGALGGGDLGLFAAADIVNVSASLPETLVVSGGTTVGSAPVVRHYGGGNLLVRAGGDLESGAFLVGRGTGQITAGGAIAADPTINSVTRGPNVPLLLAVQDGFITASARGPITLGGVYDPASLPLSYDASNTIGGTTPIPVLPNGSVVLADGSIALTTTNWGTSFTTFGPRSGVALSSTAGDITAFGNGDTALEPGSAVSVPVGRLLPATLNLTAYSGNIVIDAENGDTNIVPYPTETGTSTGTIAIVAAQSVSIVNGILSMPDLITGGSQYLFGPATSLLNYVSPLGAPLASLTQGLHANDPVPAIIAAGEDISGSIELIKPARIAAGHDITLDFIGQNNNPSDITSIVAGHDLGGFLVNNPIPSSYYLYGPGAFLLQAGHDLGPFRRSIDRTTAGIAAVGNGSNLGGAFVENLTLIPLGIVPYLPGKSADISVRFGVAPGIDYETAIRQFVDPARAGSRGIDFLAEIAAAFEVTRDEAWAAFRSLSPERQHLLVDRAFLEFLTRVALDYRDASSPYFGQYARAYEAIGTLFPAAFGYTDNAGTGSGGVGAAVRVETGRLDIAQSVLETQMGGDIDIIGPGGGIVVGTTSRDLLSPSQEGILTLAGGTIRGFTDGDILLNQSRVMTLQGGDIDLFAANGDISAGEGPKTYVSNPPISSICDMNGVCRVNPSGLVTGAGIAALVTLPGQDPAASNVTLVAPRGTVDAGAAGVRVSGNLNIVAAQVANAFNIQVQGSTTGLAVQSAPNIGALTATSNVAGATQATVASSAERGTGSDVASVFIVEVIGYGGGSDEDERRRRGQ